MNSGLLTTGQPKIRFLLDENLSPSLKLATLNLNPAIDILRVGEPKTPLLSTPDPDVLLFLELSQRILVTNNRKSMPGHLEAHWATGRHIWGLFWIRSKASISQLAQELDLVWQTTEPQEWIDRLDWIPF